MSEQQFLVTVQRMCVADEGSVVVGWSGVITEKDLSKVELKLATEMTASSLEGAPVTNLRPMTEDEIREWRHSEDEE